MRMPAMNERTVGRSAPRRPWHRTTLEADRLDARGELVFLFANCNRNGRRVHSGNVSYRRSDLHLLNDLW